jgi:hypothetical protein
MTAFWSIGHPLVWPAFHAKRKPQLSAVAFILLPRVFFVTIGDDSELRRSMVSSNEHSQCPAGGGDNGGWYDPDVIHRRFAPIPSGTEER